MSTTNAPATKTAMSPFFGEVYVTNVHPPKSAENLVKSELIRYKSESPQNIDGDPIVWLREKE